MISDTEAREQADAAPSSGLVRNGFGLLAFAVAAFLIMSGGALIVFVPLRSQSTTAVAFHAGDTPVGSVAAGDLRLSAGPNDAGTPQPKTSFFSPGCPEIDLSADLTGVHATTPVAARLEYLAAESPYDATSVYVSADGPVTFRFPRLSARWPSGLWRASLMVSGQEAAFTEFAVK